MSQVVITEYRGTMAKMSWPRMRDGATLVVISQLQDDASWLSWIEGHDHWCGSGADVFASVADMQQFIESAIALYVCEPDEKLTADGTEARDWLRETFEIRAGD